MQHKQIIFPITSIQYLVVLIVSALVFLGIFRTFSAPSEYDTCMEEYNKSIVDLNLYNLQNPNYPIFPIANPCNNQDVLTSTGETIKELTLRDMFSLGSCRFINDKHKLPKYNLEWKAYDIACEKGKSFEVRSPGRYRLSYKGYGTNLGNYIILTRENSEIETNERIVLAHIVNNDEQNTVYNYYDVVGVTDISGASTNYHVHIELWDGYHYADRNMLLTGSYQSWDGSRLLNHRGWDFGQPEEAPPVYYFTAYNLGDPNQNDSTPCIGASGKDLCYLERNGVRTMALTSDIRQQMGIKFGDSVKLTGDKGCEGIYQVEDEMNKRFRQSPGIKRPGTNYYIKGDLPSKQGGACSITKL